MSSDSTPKNPNQYDLFGGTPPHCGVKTSMEAAESVRGSAGTIRHKIYKAIEQSALGLTCDEAEALLSLSHQTCSARFRELKIKGRIVNKDDESRKTRSGRRALVWRAA